MRSFNLTLTDVSETEINFSLIKDNKLHLFSMVHIFPNFFSPQTNRKMKGLTCVSLNLTRVGDFNRSKGMHFYSDVPLLFRYYANNVINNEQPEHSSVENDSCTHWVQESHLCKYRTRDISPIYQWRIQRGVFFLHSQASNETGV